MVFPSKKESVTESPAESRRLDADLVSRCRRGESEAFEELYQRYSGRLFGLACRMAASKSDAEDLLQEIFLLAYRKLSTFKGESALSTWLYRLAMNQCLDHRRSRAGRNASATDSLDTQPGAERALGHHAPGDMMPTRLDLERAIATLPDGCREVFLLHDVEGLEHREIGDILGIAEGTSKSQVHKARLRIRAYLAGGPATGRGVA